jgi:hypothetical protein
MQTSKEANYTQKCAIEIMSSCIMKYMRNFSYKFGMWKDFKTISQNSKATKGKMNKFHHKEIF